MRTLIMTTPTPPPPAPAGPPRLPGGPHPLAPAAALVAVLCAAPALAVTLPPLFSADEVAPAAGFMVPVSVLSLIHI